MENSNLDVKLYDRQIRSWGKENQEKLSNTTIVFTKLSQITAEAARNLSMLGLKKVFIKTKKLPRELEILTEQRNNIETTTVIPQNNFLILENPNKYKAQDKNSSLINLYETKEQFVINFLFSTKYKKEKYSFSKRSNKLVKWMVGNILAKEIIGCIFKGKFCKKDSFSVFVNKETLEVQTIENL